MRQLRLLLGVVLLAGCDSAPEPPTESMARGELLSFACQACHSLQRGAPHLLGPNLHGIFGRTAGSAAGFAGYSEAMRNSGVVWSPSELDRWLANPADYLPGTTMTFTGFQEAADRGALINFLVEATGPAAASGSD